MAKLPVALAWRLTSTWAFPRKACDHSCSRVVTNTKLPRTTMVDERRTQWPTALNALAERLAR